MFMSRTCVGVSASPAITPKKNMKFLKKLFRFFAAVGNDNKRREPPATPANHANEKSGELTREQLDEILNWLSLY